MCDEGLKFPALESVLDRNCIQSSLADHSSTTDETQTSPSCSRKKVTFSKKTEDRHEASSQKDEEDAKSPGLSYIALISMAIQSNSEKKMLLSEIYHWIAERYPYYQMKDKSWRNSIRHNLSLNECFVKIGRSENGKGNYWSIHPANIEDFSRGDFRRRRARRRVRKCDEDLQRLCSPPHLTQTPRSCSENASTEDAYVPMVASLVPPNFLFSLGIDSMKPISYWVPSNNKHPVLTEYSPHDELFNSSYPFSQGYSDLVRCENMSQPQCAPFYGTVNNSDSFPGTSGVEPTLNVNVSVNVCGNRAQH